MNDKIISEENTSQSNQRQCAREECGKMKPLTEFHRATKPGTHQVWCKDCVKEVAIKNAQNRKAKSERIKALAKKNEEVILTPVPPIPAEEITQERMNEFEKKCLGYPPPLLSSEPHRLITLPAMPTQEINPLIEKRCSRQECQKIKPLSEFHRGSNKDGLHSWCKECTTLGSKQYNLREKELRKQIRESNESQPMQVIPESALTAVPEIKINPLIEKQCKRKDCLKIKPLSNFYMKSDGHYSSYCKECFSKMAKDKSIKKIIQNEKPASLIKKSETIRKTEKSFPDEKREKKVMEDFRRKKISDFLGGQFNL